MAKFQLTKKEILKEVYKCGKDPLYFINNYVKISHPLRGLIPFKMYPYQEQLVEDFRDHRFNIALKGRQLGVSTQIAAYAAWLMVFHRDKTIMVVATKFDTAANLVRKVKAMIKRLPAWVRIASVSQDNRTSFELDNGSVIKASATSEDAGRSEALSLLIIDEAAHVAGLEDLWKAIYPTLSTGGRCIAVSTPNGVGNWFHQEYVNAVDGKNDFHPTMLMWDVHPERDQAWFDKETKNMNRRDIAQELECSFNMSGETVFDPLDLERMLKLVKPPLFKTGFDRNLWIWQEPQPSMSYLLVADVARGDGQDYSAFHIFDMNNMEIIAEYQGKITPDMFAGLINQTGREYNKCMVVIENASIGYAVLDKLVDLEYPTIYYSIKSTHEYVEQWEAEGMSGTVAGFTTSMKTRPLIIAKMEEFIRNKLLHINSSRLVNEMRTFIWENGKPVAMRNYNDDLVMACAIGCWVRDTALTENLRDMEYKKAFLGSMGKSSSQFNSAIPGMFGSKKIPGQEDARIQNERYGWLLKG